MSVLKKIGMPAAFKLSGDLLRKLRNSAEVGDLCWFERFWRPVFGYAVSLTWVLHMLTICYVVWSNNPRAPEIIMALVETTSLWSMALGVMGISVVQNTRKSPSTPKENSASPNLQTDI